MSTPLPDAAPTGAGATALGGASGSVAPAGVTGRRPINPSGAGKSAGTSTSAGSRRCSSAAAPSRSNSPARNSPAATSVRATRSESSYRAGRSCRSSPSKPKANGRSD